MKRFGLSICLILFTPLILAAQITQTGTINGTIRDQDGQPLPGVLVTITSPALILPQMDMVTGERGLFRFPALPPGNYTVTCTLAGFKTLIRKGVVVGVGITTTLDIALEQTAVEESITVTGQSPTVDVQRTSMAVSMTSLILESIPAARTLATYFNMAPGVTGDTVHGSSERDNTYNVDGVNVTDPVTGTQGGSFSLDIMEELSVQTGGLPAEYGSVRGGVINVVTKSGGNRVSGNLTGYYRHQDLQSINSKGTIFEGEFGGFDWEYEPSITIGGPIIKEKIWFFLTGDHRKNQQFELGYPWDEDENVPLDYAYFLPFGKLSFQLTKKDRIVLSFNYYNYIRHHRGASNARTVDSTWNQKTPIYTYNFQWTRFFNPNLYTNFKVAYMNYHLILTAKNTDVRIYDSAISKYWQSYGYDDVYGRDRVQAFADATYFMDDWMGSHDIKMGVEFEKSWDVRDWRNNYDQYGFGPYFRFNSANIPVYPVSRSDTYMLHYQDLVRKDKKMVLGGFVQDSWIPFPRLTLNIGFRFDHQEGIIPVQGEDREPITYDGVVYDPRVTEAFKPIIWNNLAPRLGAVFDLTGDGKTALKVSFSRYYVANILQWFVTVNPNSFITWRVRYTTDPVTEEWRPVDPDDPYYMYSFDATAGSQMDPDLKSPRIDELIVGVERELTTDMRLGIRYIRKWDRNLLEGVDLNALDYDMYLTGNYDILDPAIWLHYTPVTTIDTYYNEEVTFWDNTDTSVATRMFYTNPPDAKRDYDGVEITFDKRYSHRWSLSASFVWQKSRGLIGTDFDDSWSGEAYYDDPNAHVNAMGRFPSERAYQLKLQGVWRAPWGILISGYFRYLEGNRWTRLIRSGDLGLSLEQGTTTIYAETRGSRTLPPLALGDLRLEKDFNLPWISGSSSIALFVDIFNVFNAAIATSTWERSSSTTTVNNHIVRFGDLDDLTDPRIFRLGFRFRF